MGGPSNPNSHPHWATFPTCRPQYTTAHTEAQGKQQKSPRYGVLLHPAEGLVFLALVATQRAFSRSLIVSSEIGA